MVKRVCRSQFFKELLGHLMMYSDRRFKTATCPGVVGLNAKQVSQPAFFTFLSAFLLLLF